ncbi:hypothetical protein NE237_010854 [Protea cynaroides]|uniref:Uncharacterized protein n=1 Tax=Protea cynaroides TaxID=273540 RepID=A0A9Q0L0H5_9MAGN|nr:hypothetical protein NE237_010854 [Protea cynaroides]
MVFSARGFGQQADCLSMAEKMLFEGGGCVPWGFANEFLQTRNLLLSHVLEKEVRWNAVQAADAISDVTDMVSSMGGIDMLPHVGISKDAKELELQAGTHLWIEGDDSVLGKESAVITCGVFDYGRSHGSRSWQGYQIGIKSNNGVRYSGYGVGTVGFGGANTWYNGSTKAYGNPIPSAGYASSPLVAPSRPWSNQALYGYSVTAVYGTATPSNAVGVGDADDDLRSVEPASSFDIESDARSTLRSPTMRRSTSTRLYQFSQELKAKAVGKAKQLSQRFSWGPWKIFIFVSEWQHPRIQFGSTPLPSHLSHYTVAVVLHRRRLTRLHRRRLTCLHRLSCTIGLEGFY